MSFDSPPVAGRCPQPRFSRLLAGSLDWMVGALYRIESAIPPDYRLPPGSLIISNHLRDSDVPILTVALRRRRGMRFREPLPFFATREDLFQRGALGRLARPGLVLGWIPLGWFMHRLRARPLRRLREFTLADTVAELRKAGFGAMHPADLFNARGQRELAARLGGLPARLAAIEPRRLDGPRGPAWGLRRLRLSTLRRIDGAFREHLAAQLAGLAALLDAGCAVYIAPEGTISPDGRFGRIRGGPLALCRCAHAPVTILPNALSYDPLRSGRLRVLVRAGEPLRGLDGSDPGHFAASLRQAILRLRVVTVSHLIAGFLYTRPGRFSTRQFIAGLRRGAGVAAAAGVALDPLFERQSLEALADQRLHWLQRRRLVRRAGPRWENAWPRHTQPGWGSPAAIVAFLANSLADLPPEGRREPTA